MPSLPLPSVSTDEIRLADWLEVYALLSADRNSSSGDLERVLKRASVLNSNDAIQQKCLQVFLEVEHRAKSAAAAYPFEVSGAVIRLKSGAADFPAYIFCLLLSYYGGKSVRKQPVNPWLLFEDLCCLAAEQYIQGEVLKFGAGARANAASFRQAIDGLCAKLGEGQQFRKQSTLRRKDDKVDLIAWKEFADEWPSKVVMFGQCAAGNNWLDKVDELQPGPFWRQWMLEPNISPHLRSFYIPHRIRKEEWDYIARRADILFDRCRIAYWASCRVEVIREEPRYFRWCRSVLPRSALQ